MKRAEQLTLPFRWYFTIPNEHLTSVDCSFDYTVPSGNPITQSKTVDHPGFTELRNTLGELGLIDVNTNSVNGDSVLETFAVNGYKFNPKDLFPSAHVVGVWTK